MNKRKERIDKLAPECDDLRLELYGALDVAENVHEASALKTALNWVQRASIELDALNSEID